MTKKSKVNKLVNQYNDESKAWNIQQQAARELENEETSIDV